MVRFSKFTFNINIYAKFVKFLSKLVWRKTLFLNNENYVNTITVKFTHGN